MHKQLADSGWMSVWCSVQRMEGAILIGLSRFLAAALLGSFALTGLFFSMQTLGQGWQAVQTFEMTTFASTSGGRSRLNSPGGGCGSLDGGTVSGSGAGGGPSADLEITKFVDNPTPREGDTIVYTVLLANLGPDDATRVRVRDPLPTGVTYTGDIPSRGDYDPASGLWSIDKLPKCGNATLTLSATVNPGTAGKTITNTASYVSAEPPDSKPGNNVDNAVITIQPPAGADLAITKTVNVPNPNPGDIITYTVIVTNNGPDDATGVEVSDTLPMSLTFDRYIATQGIYTGGFWMVGDLSNTASANLAIVAKVNNNTAGQVIPNTASVLHIDQTDTVTNNNMSSVVIIVPAKPKPLYLPIIYKNYEPIICKLYSDNFAHFGNPNNVWEIRNDNEVQLDYTARLSDSINKEKYFIHVKRPGLRIVQAPVATTNQYTTEIEAYWDKNIIGYEYGLTFGQLGGPSSPAYRFVVNNVTQSYRLKYGNEDIGWKCINRPEPCWVKPTPPSIINTGSISNSLKVYCERGIAQLYINHQPVWKGEASCYGRVGLVAQAYNSTSPAKAKVYFDNFQITCSSETSLLGSHTNNRKFLSTSAGLNEDK